MIRSLVFLGCVISTAAGAQTVVAQTSLQAAVAPSTAKESALRSVFDSLVPAEPLKSALVSAYERRYKAEWDQSGGADLEKRHPGIMAATMKVGSDTYAAAIIAHFPKLRSAYVNLAGSRLTPAEIGEFADLLGSPAGQRLMASVMAALAAGLPADEARSRVLANLKGQAAPAELQRLLAFSEGATVKKLLTIRADFRPLIANWASTLNTEANPLILKNVEAASAAYVEQDLKAPKK